MTCNVKIQSTVLEILTVWGAGFSGIILPSTSRPTGSILCLQNTTCIIIFFVENCVFFTSKCCNRHKKECCQFFTSQAKLLIVTARMQMYSYVRYFQFSHNEIHAYIQGSVKIGKFTKIDNPFCNNYWINWGSSYIKYHLLLPWNVEGVGGWGNYFVVTVYLGCATGWGCIFTTGLTTTRLNSKQLHEWGHTHLGFWG